MTKQTMEAFHKLMLQEENFENALSLKEMLDKLVNYRVERAIDTFNRDTEPFNLGIKRYSNNVAFLEDSRTKLVIDIIVDAKEYTVEFFSRPYDKNETDENAAQEVLKKLHAEAEFQLYNKRFRKKFAFPKQEAEMYTFLKEFKKSLLRLEKVAKEPQVLPHN